jgi:hypothetical protein
MEVGNGKCLVLMKKVHGLVQSARKFYVKPKLIKTLETYGFTGNLMDPFLWIKQSNSGIVMMAIYVDNCLTIESDEGIKEVIEDLKKHDFGHEIEEDLKDYFSCHIKIDKEDEIAWI